MKAPAPEAHLAASVVALLEASGWDVYQEVEHLGWRADIVAVRGPLLHVIECKMAFGFAVLEQARAWLGRANLVSVATPYATGRERVCRDTAAWLGIGWLRPGVVLDEHVAPRLYRRIDGRLRRTLRPEHKTYAAAGTNGGYYSAWRGTCARLAEAVQARPGMTMRDAVAAIAHHYGTARSAQGCLLRDVEAGKVAGVEARRRWDNDVARLYPVTAP